MPVKYNDIAVKGFAEGTNEHYDKARPTYPSIVLNHIHSSLRTRHSNPSKPLNIIELGSGTGLFTKQVVGPPSLDVTLPSSIEGQLPTEVVPYPDWKIDTLLCVEPSEGMRSQWNRSISPIIASRKEKAGREDIRTIPGGFADLSEVRKIKGATWKADLVVVAQAWHWCDPDYGAAIAEIESMLTPDGMIAFVWNFERFDIPWTRQIKEFELSLSQNSPQYIRGLWKATFETEEYKHAFLKEDKRRFWWNLEIVDRSYSKSYIAIRPEREKINIRQKILSILQDPQSGKEWVDRESGLFIYPFYTEVVVMQKK